MSKLAMGFPAFIKAARRERKCPPPRMCTHLTSGRAAVSLQRDMMSGVAPPAGFPLVADEPPHSFHAQQLDVALRYSGPYMQPGFGVRGKPV